MIHPQFILPLAHELIVDLFAGGGGASTGIEQAIGRHVDIAVNHDPEAVGLHQANHPQTLHFVSDVFEVEPLVVTDGMPVGLLWASPDCKHFSKAKGGKPVCKKIRGLAWVVIRWAKLVRPRVICLENVEEFQTWGPVGADQMPCPILKGQTFKRWVAQLRNLGYVVEWRELRASDFDTPTIRKRLFLVARCDGQPIVWPKPTHAHKPEKGGGLKRWRTAAECIDWSIPAPSIFERERPLAEATLRRIAHGIRRYVLDNPRPFIVPVTHQGDDRVHSIDEPMRTVTSARRGEFALCAPTLATVGYGERDRQAPRSQDIGAPLTTVVGASKHALVSAFLAKHFGGEPQPGKTAQPMDAPAPTVLASGGPQGICTAYLTKFHTGSIGCDAQMPVPTVTSNGDGSNRQAGAVPIVLVTAHLTHFYTSNTRGGDGDLDKPLKTVTACGQHHAEVRAFLIRYFGTDQDPQLGAPLHTVTTKHRDAVVTVEGEQYEIADIGMRMLQPRELYRAQGFPDSYIIDCGADGRRLSKAAQVRMCGNSVCPPVATAIVAANFADSAVRRAA